MSKTPMQRTTETLLKAGVITQEVADGLNKAEKETIIEACAFGYAKGYRDGIHHVDIQDGQLYAVGEQHYTDITSEE